LTNPVQILFDLSRLFKLPSKRHGKGYREFEMMPAREANEIIYDAFISYSRRDKAFATLLHKALETYRPPKDLSVPQRHPRIFRDEQDFTGAEYHNSLDKHLRQSAKLIVICSPAARESLYVNDEIRRFVKIRGAESIIPILLSGIPNNEGKPGREPELAFPEALCEVLATPLASDYRGFDPVKKKIKKSPFEDAWHKTLADLYGKSRSEIEQRERKRKMRRRRVAATVGSLALILIIGTIWLWHKGYSVNHGVLKAQSLLASIHVEPRMRTVLGGTFQQGDTHGFHEKYEQPAHEVRIQTFALGKFEVTFDEYDRFAIELNRPLPGDMGWGRGRQPVIDVSWQDAKDYAGWLSKKTGKRYRLPTESEWEYAARSGGQNDIWAGTSDESHLKQYAVYGQNRTEPVGGKNPTVWELYDMSGNVMEWVEDCMHYDYTEAPTDGTAWLERDGGDCTYRIVRGGPWRVTDPEKLRSSFRRTFRDEEHNEYVGFRLAQDIDQ
jgi:formylglycine-generating enzyme required for sulfatase activity